MANRKKEPIEKAKFKVGDYVDVTRGKLKGYYGTVEVVYHEQVYDYPWGYHQVWFYDVSFPGKIDQKSFRGGSLKLGGKPVSDEEFKEVGVDLESLYRDMLDIPNVSAKMEVEVA